MENLVKKDTKYKDIFTDTIDASQGLEFDIVILDVPAMPALAGFTGKHSRAKYGFYIQVKKNDIDNSNAKWLQQDQFFLPAVSTRC